MGKLKFHYPLSATKMGELDILPLKWVDSALAEELQLGTGKL